MAHHGKSYPEEQYRYARYPDESFSPWRPSFWHLCFAVPVVVAVAVVLAFYIVL